MSNSALLKCPVLETTPEDKLEELTRVLTRAEALVDSIAQTQRVARDQPKLVMVSVESVGNTADHYANWTIGGKNWLD